MNKVVNFHDVYDKDWFEQTLLVLKNTYNIIDIKEVEDYYYKNTKLKKSCLITVDDGDKTFYDVIFPILKKHNIPAVLFVSPKAILNSENFWFQEIRGFDKGKLKKVISSHFNVDTIRFNQHSINDILKNCRIKDIQTIISNYKKQNNIKVEKHFNINIEQLKEIDKSELVTIGAHTQNHPILTNESDEDSKEEIYDSIDELSRILGRDIYYFAYPNGIPILDFSQREIDYLKKKHVKLAFSTKPNNLKIKDNPLAIPRFSLSLGSKKFVILKLFFGKYWEVIKSLKNKGEGKKRIALRKEINLIRS